MNEEITSTSRDNDRATESQETIEQSKKIDELEKENIELKDKYLRLGAEFENFKKRQARLFENMVDLAQDATILKILDILDNFERALDANKSENDTQKIIEGLHLIHKQIVDMLELQGVQTIYPVGGSFDPELHESVGSVLCDLAENSIVEVVCKGYKRSGRLIRPAKVLIASPNKTENETDDTNES